MGRPILVLGVDRSGTSLLAELVMRWGAYGGNPDQLARPSPLNARGFFENRELNRFLRDLLRGAGFHLWHASFPDRMRELALEPLYRDRAAALVESMGTGGRSWFWKEPVLGLTLPFWDGIIENPIYLSTVRNPHDTAVSWQRFTTPPELRGKVVTVAANLLRWQFMVQRFLEYTEGSDSRLFVCYEHLLSAPRRQCARLAAFLDEQTESDRSCDRSDWIAEAIDPRLRHNKTSVPFEEIELATPERVALYRLLLAKVQDADTPYHPEHYPMCPGWREYLTNLAVWSRFYALTGPLLRTRIGRALLVSYHAGGRLLSAPGRLWRQLRTFAGRHR